MKDLLKPTTTRPPHDDAGKKSHASEDSHRDSSKCFWIRSPKCVEKFTYKDKSYFGCVTSRDDDTKAWCSIDKKFDKRWKPCRWTCPHMNSNGEDESGAKKTTTTTTTVHEDEHKDSK